MDNIVFSLFENLNESDYIVASYYLKLDKSIDPYEKVKDFAIGQTLGTWTKVPGVTEQMRREYMGKVVNVIDLPPSDLVDKYDDSLVKEYIFQIAYPYKNFGAKIPMILTTLLGNDASTSTQAKLVDLYMPTQFSSQFNGPNFGVKGVRKITGVEERPLLLNMIKPCVGFTAEVGAEIFYETAKGGVDFIKDDELLANPDYCTLEDRVTEYLKASNRAFEETGKKTIYVPNITDDVDKIVSNGIMAVEKGAEMVMINFAATGIDSLHHLAKSIDVPILAHYASAGPYYEGPNSGLFSNLFLGKLARMAGADMVMINTPYGGYPLTKSRYLRTAHELMLDHPVYKNVMPAIGGGVNPGIVPTYMNDLGNDIILAAGGAVQGHPGGAASGVRAMIQAIEATKKGIDLKTASLNNKELKMAVDLWGIHD
ncbi:MAG: transcriptional regulator [Clostridiales bacterium]|nr:transcriptional regulator [Clostridiales bacterium]